MGDVMVLCYHAISESWDSSLAVKPESLERQLAFLLGRGWRPTTFAEAILSPTAPRTLAVTFDDGFASVKRYAEPILSHFGAPATMFAPTAFMDGGSLLSWSGIEHWHQTPAAAELTPLSWQQLGELAELGWEIGSHTCSHPHLTKLTPSELERELVQSREQFADRLGRVCDSIAYPYGDVDERVARVSESVGYRAGAALSNNLRPLGSFRHPRIGIYRVDRWSRFRLKMWRPMRIMRASPMWPNRAILPT